MAASSLVDLVKIYATNQGTGALTLGEAVQGFRGVEALMNGATYSYSIQQDAQWEIGKATFLAVDNQLVRTPTDSSNGGGAVDFQANAAIAFVALSEDILARDVLQPLYGFGPPLSGQGLIGQTYTDLTKPVTLYGPKTSSGWGGGVVLQGENGAPGTAASYKTLEDLKAADPAALFYVLLDRPGGTNYTLTPGNYEGRADDVDVVRLNAVPLATGALVRQRAESVAAAGGPSAPPLTGRTMQRYADDDLPPAWFGIVGDGSANDNAGLGYALEFAAEMTQAADPYSPANLTAAKIAQSIDFKGKRIKVTQPRVIENRKVDRTNGFLEFTNAAFIIDGDFTLFVSDTPPVEGGQPNAEFIAFSRSLFFNPNPSNTATSFDERFLRMRFDRCQWWQQRFVNTTTAFAQEVQFRDCMARNWPAGQAWFKTAGGYAVRSFGSKWQNGGGNVFEMNSADAGVVDCSHYGFTVESNSGHFVRYGQIQGGGLFGGYSEKNGAALVNTTTLPGGRNRGFNIIGVQSDPIASRRADPNAFEFILGAGGAAVIGCHSTGNLVDNSACEPADVVLIGNALLDPLNNRMQRLLYRPESVVTDLIVPDDTGGFGAVAASEINIVITPNGPVVGQTVSLTYPYVGKKVQVANTGNSPFLLRPDRAISGAKFRGGGADVAIEFPPMKSRSFVGTPGGVWSEITE